MSYQFTARNNYGETENFSPYHSKREAHAAQDRRAERGYTNFSAVTEEVELRQPTEPDAETMHRILTQAHQFVLGKSHLPEVPLMDEQEPEEDEDEAVDVIASGYDWTCPRCQAQNHEIEYGESVTCPVCERAFSTNPPEHAYA